MVRLKYHPKESVEKREDQLRCLRTRVEVFQEMADKERMAGVTLDVESQKQIVRLLDAVVIKLEGGSDFDLTVLDKTAEELEEVVKKETVGEAKDNPEGDSERPSRNLESNSENVEEATGKEEDKGKSIEGKETKAEEESADGSVRREAEIEPRPLHRTSSIFLRNISPQLTKKDLASFCQRYQGFMRISLSDPNPEKRWYRRGWVTFQRNTRIKEICFNLNNIRLKDTDLGPVVNKDLSKRVRQVSKHFCSDI